MRKSQIWLVALFLVGLVAVPFHFGLSRVEHREITLDLPHRVDVDAYSVSASRFVQLREITPGQQTVALQYDVDWLNKTVDWSLWGMPKELPMWTLQVGSFDIETDGALNSVLLSENRRSLVAEVTEWHWGIRWRNQEYWRCHDNHEEVV